MRGSEETVGNKMILSHKIIQSPEEQLGLLLLLNAIANIVAEMWLTMWLSQLIECS